MSTGILGGTFDPIHLGHLRAAEEARELLGLDRVLFLPARIPPHKRDRKSDDARRRLDRVAAAIDGNPTFEVSTIDVDREGPSYSADTVTILRTAHPEEAFWWILGRDAFEEIDSWKSLPTLFAECHLAVVSRPPFREPSPDAMPVAVREAFCYQEGHGVWRQRNGNELRFLKITGLDISSSSIRAALREGRSIRYLVPEPVRRMLEAEAGRA